MIPEQIVVVVTDLKGGETDQQYIAGMQDGIPEEWVVSPTSVQAVELTDYSDAEH